VSATLNHERHQPELNFFGVNASQLLAEWRSDTIKPVGRLRGKFHRKKSYLTV
jgi:hypothetical protein